MPSFVFPGHRYLGPGNPVNNGVPVDRDDEIAMRHDIAYENASTKRAVRKADRVAIKEFAKDAVMSGNWHSVVGAAGLSAKYAAETVVGVQYPRIKSGCKIPYEDLDREERVRARTAMMEEARKLEKGKKKRTEKPTTFSSVVKAGLTVGGSLGSAPRRYEEQVSPRQDYDYRRVVPAGSSYYEYELHKKDMERAQRRRDKRRQSEKWLQRQLTLRMEEIEREEEEEEERKRDEEVLKRIVEQNAAKARATANAGTSPMSPMSPLSPATPAGSGEESDAVPTEAEANETTNASEDSEAFEEKLKAAPGYDDLCPGPTSESMNGEDSSDGGEWRTVGRSGKGKRVCRLGPEPRLLGGAESHSSSSEVEDGASAVSGSVRGATLAQELSAVASAGGKKRVRSPGAEKPGKKPDSSSGKSSSSEAERHCKKTRTQKRKTARMDDEEVGSLMEQIFGESSAGNVLKGPPKPPLLAKKEEATKLKELETKLSREELCEGKTLKEAVDMFAGIVAEMEDWMTSGKNMNQKAQSYMATRLRKLKFINEQVVRRAERYRGFVEGLQFAGYTGGIPATVPVREVPTTARKTFSEAARGPKKTTKVILVDKPDEKVSSTAFKAEIAEKLKPRKEGLKILSIRENPKGIKIVTQDSETEKKIRASKSLDGLTVKSKSEKQLRPRMIIYDVPRDLSEKDVLEAIRKQNTKLKREQFAGMVKVAFKTGKKDGEFVHYIIEADKELRAALIETGRVFIEYQACKIRDFIRITRCFNCLGLGHIAKFCRSPEVCSHCAGEGHKGEVCPNKGKPPVCANCKRLKKKADHNSRDPTCPALLRAERSLIARTDV